MMNSSEIWRIGKVCSITMKTSNVYIIAGPNGSGKKKCEGAMKKRLSLQDKAELAMKAAVRGVIERHKMTGRPLAVWENNRVRWISAAEALRRWK